MNSTDKPSIYVKLVAFLIVTIFFYCLLILCDYIVARYVFSNSVNSAAHRIEAEREKLEDFPERLKAVSEGFNPIITPGFVDDNIKFRLIAQKYDVAPLAPQPNTDLYFCNEGYGLIKYRSDRFGFRNIDKAWERDTDVVMIGDSFTHGACLEHKETIAGYLETSLNVINLGTSGNEPIHYSALAKVFLPKIKPKYAAIIFYANDNGVGVEESYYYKHYFINKKGYFEDPKDSNIDPNLKSFYKDSNILLKELLSKNINGSEENFIERGPIFQRIKRYFSLPFTRHLLRNFINKSNKLDFGSKLAIDTLNTTCLEIGCKPLVVFIPNSNFWRPDSRAKVYETLLLEYSLKSNIQFWSSRVELEENGSDNGYALKGPHLSPLGNSIVAKGIGNLIAR